MPSDLGSQGIWDVGLGESPVEINFFWLRRLRWAVFWGQVSLVVSVYGWMGASLPLDGLWLVLWGAFCSNLALRWWSRPSDAWLIGWMGGAIALDTVALTVLLALTGGPTNPFSFFYLVYVVLAILILPQRWGWLLAVGALLCYGALFWGWEGAHAHHLHSPLHMKMHLEGMWLAYAITSGFVAWFVSRTKWALTVQAAKIRSFQSLHARNEKLAALAALAGGAMHEMATPLSTIALVAKELQYTLQHPTQDADLSNKTRTLLIEDTDLSNKTRTLLIEDTLLIRQQVELCHRILRELVHQAGDSLGEAHQSVRLVDLFAMACQEVDDKERIEQEVSEDAKERMLSVPLQAMTRVLRGILRNAIDASDITGRIVLSARCHSGMIEIAVRDQGCGMRPEVAAQAGEPFFTTKPAGQGHGLGLFLARTVAEHLGGKMLFDTTLGKGTTVFLQFPL